MPQRQGQKRFRNGEAKSNNKAVTSEKKSSRLAPEGRVDPKKGGNSQLEGEIYSLGGTNEDLELLQEVDSASEIEDGINTGRKGIPQVSGQEVMDMVRQLGINQMKAEDLISSEENEEETHREELGFSTSRIPTAVDEKAMPRSTNKDKTGSIFPARSDWHAIELPTPPEKLRASQTQSARLSDQVHTYAKGLLEKENLEFAASQRNSSSSHEFYTTLMKTGTLSDKISALTLSVQESPVHNMKALENLVNLARKRSRDQAVNVLAALKDLFGPGNLLPSHRHLKPFSSNLAAFMTLVDKEDDISWTINESLPLPLPLKKVHLIYWAFEDWLKNTYFQILQILETWCNDEVVFSRVKAVEYASQLLKEKPEQEANLLRLVINKLGDSDKKVASRTSHQILQIQTNHPVMKLTIINALESDVLFRPGQSLNAQYFATITLNQTVLSNQAEDVTRKLLEIYFNLFVKLLQRPEKPREDVEAPSKVKVNKKGQIQGGGSLPGKKAMRKEKADKTSTNEQDLREKLLSALLTGVNRAIPYLNANDDFLERHLDTLFQVTHSSNFNTSIQALILIQQISTARLASQDRFYRVLYESLLDVRLLASSKQAMYLNLLFKALRGDLNQDRVKSFAKRLLQIASIHQPPFSCGILYMLRELERTCPALAIMTDEGEQNLSDDEEIFRDVDEDVISAKGTTESPETKENSLPTRREARSKYDPLKRDPLFAMAKQAPLWEIAPLVRHFHPSVSLFSERMLKHEVMPPVPDLQQNTLIHFLDRFVFKNPKSAHVDRVKGTSIMQPLVAGGHGNILLPSYSLRSRIERPVNTEAFRQQDSTQVSANEVFFHRYFGQVGDAGKAKQKRDKKEKKRKLETANSDEDEDKEEEEIWQALVNSNPEIEGDKDESEDPDDGEGLEGALSDEFASEDDMDVGDGTSEDIMLDLDDPDSESTSSGAPIRDDVAEDVEPGSVGPLGSKDKAKIRKRKLKSLPTFADASEYAKMLDEVDD